MSKKLPSIQFYPGDWKKDAELSMCSLATRGFWFELLGAMHELGRSGQITGTAQQLARVGRCTAAEAEDAIAELKETKAAVITERDGIFTIINRRMKREFDDRESNKKYVAKSRKKENVRSCKTNVRPVSDEMSDESNTSETIDNQQLTKDESVLQDDCKADCKTNVRLYSSTSTSKSIFSDEKILKEKGGGGGGGGSRNIREGPPPAAAADIFLTEDEKRMNKKDFEEHLRAEFAHLENPGRSIAECVSWFKKQRQKPPNRLQVKRWLAEEYEDFDVETDLADKPPDRRAAIKNCPVCDQNGYIKIGDAAAICKHKMEEKI